MEFESPEREVSWSPRLLWSLMQQAKRAWCDWSGSQAGNCGEAMSVGRMGAF